MSKINMQDFINVVSTFLDYEDVKILQALSKDNVTIRSIAKIFENPIKAEKFLTLVKSRPLAVYIVAKISERISKYLRGEDSKICFRLFLRALTAIKNVQDKVIRQKTFLLLKEAMDRRIDEENLEELSILLSNFYDIGFKKYLDKLLFSVSLLAERGEYQKAVNILNLIDHDSAKKLKSAILAEWAMSLEDYEKALKLLNESLDNDRSDYTLSTLAKVYENSGDFERALEIYNQMNNKDLYSIIKVLESWGKTLKRDEAIETLKRAFKIAVQVDDALATDIFNSLVEVLRKKIESEIKCDEK